MINKLKKLFEGSGEVSGMNFKQISETEKGYIYLVTDESNLHVEVFLKKISPLCIDFEKKIFSETDFKEIYPKSKDFGVWAWTYRKIQCAVNKLNSL